MKFLARQIDVKVHSVNVNEGFFSTICNDSYSKDSIIIITGALRKATKLAWRDYFRNFEKILRFSNSHDSRLHSFIIVTWALESIVSREQEQTQIILSKNEVAKAFIPD